MKRTPMPPRDPAKADAWRRRSKPLAPSTQPLRHRSPRMEEVYRKYRPVVAALLAPGTVCAAAHLGNCFGPMTSHHVKSRARGGDYTSKNLLALCNGHNGWVEDEPRAALALGLAVHSWEMT